MLGDVQHKDLKLIEAKADDGGSFVALASVFGNVDSVGDRVLPGAFAKSLERWRQSGDPIPVILSHQWEDPMAMIGKALPAMVSETERGLEVRGTLDIEHNETARQVHRLMLERLLKGWSFGYTVPAGGQERKDGINEISEINLIEVGPTLVGANPEAELQAVKSALGDPTPAQAGAQLQALAIEIEQALPASEKHLAGQLGQLADVFAADTSSTPPRGDLGPSGEEPAAPAKPDRHVVLRREVRRLQLDAELHR